MNKIALIPIFFPILLFSGLNMNNINNVLLNIHSKKELTYYNCSSLNNIETKLEFTSFENADILLFPKELNNQRIENKVLIVGSYQELKRNKNSIGAIYLKKNRTQIIFIKERLKDKGLTLPKKFNKYIVSACRLNSKCI
jgi:hypothetical protein